MIELTATHFAARNPKSITIANRTIERGRQLAERFHAEAITLTEMPDALPRFDIIVTCTASTLPILGKGLLERVVKRAGTRRSSSSTSPCRATSSARWRNSTTSSCTPSTTCRTSSSDNLQVRKEAVVQAEAMIATQTESFLRWLEGRSGGADDHARSTATTSSCA